MALRKSNILRLTLMGAETGKHNRIRREIQGEFRARYDLSNLNRWTKKTEIKYFLSFDQKWPGQTKRETSSVRSQNCVQKKQRMRKRETGKRKKGK